MQTVHLKKSDDFAIFIENPGGSWFEISGQGRVALTPREDMSNQQKLKTGLKGFVQWVTSDRTLVIREIAGTISCMAVIVAYVSGYTFGTWFHNTKNN